MDGGAVVDGYMAGMEKERWIELREDGEGGRGVAGCGEEAGSDTLAVVGAGESTDLEEDRARVVVVVAVGYRREEEVEEILPGAGVWGAVRGGVGGMRRGPRGEGDVAPEAFGRG